METFQYRDQTEQSLTRKFNLFLFFSLMIVFVEACHFKVDEHDVNLNDEIRNIHAQQLLTDRPFIPVAEFNGDRNFSNYITAYIEKQAKQLDSSKFTTSLLNVSRMHSYDPIFLLAVIRTESKFNPNAIGLVGEVGLMQIKPETAEWICDKNNLVWRGANALKDPEYNILIGSYYIQYLKRTLKSESFKYVTAYNMGLNGLSRLGGEKPKENTYFERVIGNYLEIYAELKKIKKNTGVGSLVSQSKTSIL